MKNMFSKILRLPLPWGLVFMLCGILLIESAIGHWGVLLLDPSTRALRYIKARMEDPTPDDIAVFGTRSMALDVAALEKDLGGKFSIQNYSMPHSGSNTCFALALRKYLQHKSKKPKLMFISIPQECFIAFIYSYNISNIRMERTIELFDRDFCAKYIFKADNKPTLDVYYSPRRIFPSYREKLFIWKHYVRGNFFKPAIMIPFLKDSVRRGKLLKATKGQTLMNENKQLSPEYAVAYLPSPEETLKRQGYTDSLEEFFRIANENKIQTVFFETPLTKMRSDKMLEVGYFPYFDEVMNEIVAKYPYVSYGSIEGIREWDLDLLADWAHHINNKGAKRFNREFAQMVKAELERRKML